MKRIDMKEMPRGCPFNATSPSRGALSDSLLPTDQLNRGYHLESVEVECDPVCLYDRFGKIAYEWPEGFMPKYCDVAEVCQKLGL